MVKKFAKLNTSSLDMAYDLMKDISVSCSELRQVLPTNVLSSASLRSLLTKLVISPSVSLKNEAVLRTAMYQAASGGRSDADRVTLLVEDAKVRQSVPAVLARRTARAPALVPIKAAIPTILSDCLPSLPMDVSVFDGSPYQGSAAATVDRWDRAQQHFMLAVDRVTDKFAVTLGDPATIDASAVTDAGLLGVDWGGSTMAAFVEAFEVLRVGATKCTMREFSQFLAELLGVKPAEVATAAAAFERVTSAVDHFYAATNDMMRCFEAVTADLKGLTIAYTESLEAAGRAADDMAAWAERQARVQARLDVMQDAADATAREAREAAEEELRVQTEAMVKAEKMEGVRRRKERAALSKYKDGQEAAAFREKEKQEADERRAKAAVERELARGKERVAARRTIDKGRAEERVRQRVSRDAASARTKATLNRMARKVAPSVEADPSRMTGPTQASTKRAWGRDGWRADRGRVTQHALPTLHGYSEGDLMKDQRFQLLVRLGEANLLHSKYAVDKVMAARPMAPERPSVKTNIKLDHNE